MITILKETTKNPISLMGERAGVCWGADISNEEKNFNRGLDCIESGHHRVMEYVNVEMVIGGYSARVIREWYTHIGGSPTRLQASTRYINYQKFECVIPNSIMRNREALEGYYDAINQIRVSLRELERLGIPREDSAMLLPLGMTTKIVDKRNLRNLVEMSHQRLCTRAYWEYKKLMYDIMYALCEYSEEWEYLVENYFMPKCDAMGYCNEKNGCGRKGGANSQ